MKKINQRDYRNLYLGNSGLTVANYGCYSACLAMLFGLSMKELITLFNKKGVFTNTGLIKHPDDAEVLNSDYRVTYKAPDFLCIAEVDFNPDPKKDQHFVVWLGDGDIIDPWGGVHKKNPYKVYSYRIYNLDNTMKKYYITSELRDELEKIWDDFEHTEKESQKRMARKLDDYRKAHDLELVRQKNALTVEFNQKLKDLQEKLEVCEKLKDGFEEMANDNEFAETLKLLEDINIKLRAEITKQDLEIAKLKSEEGILKGALRIVAGWFNKLKK